MIHLDTHVLVWIHYGRTEVLPPAIHRLLRQGGLRPLVSPMVRLEMAFLHEVGRLPDSPTTILDSLRVEIDLGPAESSFEKVSAIAATLSWTRDPFDRMIAAHAMADDVPLITRDRVLLEHCPVARWSGLAVEKGAKDRL